MGLGVPDLWTNPTFWGLFFVADGCSILNVSIGKCDGSIRNVSMDYCYSNYCLFLLKTMYTLTLLVPFFIANILIITYYSYYYCANGNQAVVMFAYDPAIQECPVDSLKQPK